jgi:4'-phosphopantetheinyl transferase
MRSEPACPAPDEVRVHSMDIAQLRDRPGAIAEALTWLRPDERARFDRYRHDDDRLMFLAGRVMARSIVGAALGMSPGAWIWREGPHGRPEIDRPLTSLRFNLAHSAGLVVCALADGRDVGVDVEDCERRPPDKAIVRRYCSPAEADDIEAQGPDGWHDRFLTYWTLKEAYLKARGLGISVPLSEINFVLNGARPQIEFLGSQAGHTTHWTFDIRHVSPRHIVAIAAEGVGGVFHSFRPFGAGGAAR